MVTTTSRRGFLTTAGALALSTTLEGKTMAAAESKPEAPAPVPATDAQAAPAGTGRRPNIVVIMADQVQAARMRLYGGKDLQTPHLDKMAEEGALFTRCFTTSPVCTPSRQSLWSGRYPHTFGGVFNNVPLPEDLVHLPLMLKKAGYTNALVGKNHCFHPKTMPDYIDYEWPNKDSRAAENEDPQIKEFDHISAGEFVRLTHGRIVDMPSQVTGTARTTQAALDYLEKRGDEPFFLWLSYVEPHSPFIITKEYADRYDPATLTLPKSWGSSLEAKPANLRELHDLMQMDDVSEDHLRFITQIYYAMMSQVDDGIGQVLARLKEKGLDENTIVVFVSDHGEYLGNVDMLQKSAHLYDALIHVPLIVRWPGHIPNGLVVDELVEHHDLMPTLSKFAKLDLPEGVQAKDLSAGLTGGTFPSRDAIFSEIGFHADADLKKQKTYTDLPQQEARAFYHFVFGHYAQIGRCIRTQTHKLAVYESGERELYDLVADPEEMVNLYGRPEAAEVQKHLTERFMDWTLASANATPDIMATWNGTGLRQMLSGRFAEIPDAT